MNQYCRHHQKPFQPANVHPSVLNLFFSLTWLLNSRGEITSQITNEISTCENNPHVDNSRFENSISCCCGPTELGSQSCPGRPCQEPGQRDNGAAVQHLIKKKNRSRICQFCPANQSLLGPVNPEMHRNIKAGNNPKPK